MSVTRYTAAAYHYSVTFVPKACTGIERTVCTDGDCDVHEVICDGIVDCDDGSDEENCGKALNQNGFHTLATSKQATGVACPLH